MKAKQGFLFDLLFREALTVNIVGLVTVSSNGRRWEKGLTDIHSVIALEDKYAGLLGCLTLYPPVLHLDRGLWHAAWAWSQS